MKMKIKNLKKINWFSLKTHKTIYWQNRSRLGAVIRHIHSTTDVHTSDIPVAKKNILGNKNIFGNFFVFHGISSQKIQMKELFFFIPKQPSDSVYGQQFFQKKNLFCLNRKR